MASISKFLSVTEASFAQPSLYTVEIGADLGGGAGAKPEEKIMLNCNTVMIPQLAINYTEHQYRQMPHKRLYGEVAMTFQISEDFAELKYFDDWFRQVGWSGNGHFAYHTNYVRNIIIRNYSRENKLILTTEIYKAFPTTLDSIALGYATTGSTIPLAVKCGYWWHQHKYGNKEITGEPVSATTNGSDGQSFGRNLKAINGTNLLDFSGAQ